MKTKAPSTARERWRRHVRAWKASGKSSTEYAAEAGINAHTLTWWSWRLRTERGDGQKRAGAKRPELEFVEFTAPGVATPQSSAFELEVGGVRVRLPSDFETAALRRLLEVLEARP